MIQKLFNTFLIHRNELLSVRLLIWVVLCSSFFTLLVTAIQLYTDFQQEVSHVHHRLKVIEETYLDSLAISAYDMDDRQLLFQLRGILRLEDIEYLEIVEEDENGEHILARQGNALVAPDIYREFDLNYPHQSAKITTGAKLKVTATLKGVYQRMLSKLMIILVSNACKTFIASLFILVIIRYLVIRHLTTMAEYAQQLDLNKLDQELILDRGKRDEGSNDELDRVVKSINDMRLDMLKDIRERNQARSDLARSEENLRITLNSIGDAVISTNNEGLIIHMNPVAERLAGWSQTEAQEKPFTDVFNLIDSNTREPRANPIEFILKSGEAMNLEGRTALVSVDGSERQVDVSGSPIRNESGDILGSVLVFRDITETQQLEEQLRQSQKMESIGQLAGGVAHDFNNLLGGIIGAADLLEMDITDERQREYINMIIDTSNRASDLTRKLLDFSRKGRQVSKLVDLHTIILEVVQLLERSIDRRIRVELKLDAPSSYVLGDPSQLQNIFLNLGLNARDAMPEGGLIIFESRQISFTRSDADASQYPITAGRFIEIIVTDTGVGMSEDIQSRIFEPFYTTKGIGKGTGLGLASVYGTVIEHFGSIDVESAEGKGSSFSIALPLVEAGDVEEESEHSRLHEGTGKVLLVDDEFVIRHMIEGLLTQLGYEVETAENGNVAIEKFKEQHESIDVVILDMIMPECNGTDTFKQLVKIDPNVKVVLSSGFSHDKTIANLLDAGAVDFLQKPYRRSNLSEILSRVINS